MNSVAGASKRTDALANRARLLAVAQAVFAEAGLDLEVNDVISRAQLGVGTFYRHFVNREDLLREIVAQTVEDAQAQIRQAIEPYAGDPRAAFQALVAAQLRVYQRYRCSRGFRPWRPSASSPDGPLACTLTDYECSRIRCPAPRQPDAAP